MHNSGLESHICAPKTSENFLNYCWKLSLKIGISVWQKPYYQFLWKETMVWDVINTVIAQSFWPYLEYTLFSLKINWILEQSPSAVCGSLYVDDLHISCQRKDMCFIERQLQIAIDCTMSWTNEFFFPTGKTSYVHFCRMQHSPWSRDFYKSLTNLCCWHIPLFGYYIWQKKWLLFHAF